MPTAFRSVIFDCDSTLVSVEGIDLLASSCREEVAALTAAAMSGALPLEEVYHRRLELIGPHRRAVEALGSRYRDALVPEAARVCRALEAAGVQVWVISGGLVDPVLHLASVLGLPPERVEAVQVRFDPRGRYVGLLGDQPLARAGGKPVVVRSWGRRLARPALMVGDGVTDLEVGPEVEGFAAFGGVVRRPAVWDRAPIRIPGPSLAPVYPLALAGPGACQGRPSPPGGADPVLWRRGLEEGWEIGPGA